MPTVATAPTLTRQELFVAAYLPVIERGLSYRFRALNSEAKAEAVQDCLASAWRGYQRAGDRAWNGQTDRRYLVTPSKLMAFSAGKYKEGVGFLGGSRVDVHASACRLRGRANHQSESITTLISHDRANPYARFRAAADWSTIARRCSPKARKVIALLFRGHETREIAGRLKVSGSRVRQIKTEIATVAADLGYAPRRWRTAEPIANKETTCHQPSQPPLTAA